MPPRETRLRNSGFTQIIRNDITIPEDFIRLSKSMLRTNFVHIFEEARKPRKYSYLPRLMSILWSVFLALAVPFFTANFRTDLGISYESMNTIWFYIMAISGVGTLIFTIAYVCVRNSYLNDTEFRDGVIDREIDTIIGCSSSCVEDYNPPGNQDQNKDQPNDDEFSNKVRMNMKSSLLLFSKAIDEIKKTV